MIYVCLVFLLKSVITNMPGTNDVIQEHNSETEMAY